MQYASSIPTDFFLGSPERDELRGVFHKNTMRGLILATALHFIAIGAYYLTEYLAREDGAPTVQVRILRYSELGPPPSLTTAAQPPAIGIASPKPSIGIPTPVPDVEISPEQTIATQQELSQMQSPAAIEGAGDVLVQDIVIDDFPGIDAFVPVEKLPMPIRQVSPVYPEIARRAGVEATVHAKILVDKEGNARKAVIIKSDSEIFNDVVIEAALQWKFTPAIMNNGPVAVWVSIPFRFRLSDKPS